VSVNRVNRQRQDSRVELRHQLRLGVLSLAFLLRDLFKPGLLLAGLRDVAGDELFRLVCGSSNNRAFICLFGGCSCRLSAEWRAFCLLISLSLLTINFSQ